MFDSIEIAELQAKVRIRVIDDDEDFLKSLGLLLEMTGWTVRTYKSAKEFLSDENFSTPGCILLDLRMPEMTGLELQRNLITQNKNNLPIIFLTGHGDVDSAVYTLKNGAFDFLQKPRIRLSQRRPKKVSRHSPKTVKERKSMLDTAL